MNEHGECRWDYIDGLARKGGFGGLETLTGASRSVSSFLSPWPMLRGIQAELHGRGFDSRRTAQGSRSSVVERGAVSPQSSSRPGAWFSIRFDEHGGMPPCPE